MRIIEVSTDKVFETKLQQHIGYMNYRYEHYDNFSNDVFIKDPADHILDVCFLILVDQLALSYLKYVFIKHQLGLLDEQILWVQNSHNQDALVDNQYEGLKRKIIYIREEEEWQSGFMKAYHIYMSEKVTHAAQQTIQKTMRSMLEFIGEGILILDANKRIVFMNQQGSSICGVSTEDVHMKDFQDVFHVVDGDTKEPIEDVFAKLTKKEPYIGLPFNSAIFVKSGERKYVSANISFLYKSILKGYFVIIRDISRIKRNENRLRRLSKAVEYSPSSVVITELNGDIEYVNPKFEELTGYTKEEVMGKNPNILKSGFTSDEEYKNLWNTILSGKIWQGELMNRKKTGENYWESVLIGPVYNDNHRIDRFVAVKQDITKERELISEMESERNMFDMLIQSAPIGLVLYDVENGPVRMNDRAQSIVNAFGTDIKCLDSFIVREGDLTLEQAIRQVVGDNVIFPSIEMRVMQKGRNRGWVRLGIVPFVYQNQRHALFSIDDITKNKELEEALKVARDEAKEADKAKSMFLANMSHEIRTPINGIIGMTELTLTMGELEEEQRSNLRLVQYSSRNLLKIINDILDISKLDAGKIEIETIPFDVHKIIRNTQQSFAEKAAEKSLILESLDGINTKNMLIGDPFRIQQIMNNLVNNAIKFTEVGTVSFGIHHKPRAVEEIGEEGEPIWLEITVEDTGIGISEKERQVLFQRFSQVDSTITRQYGGTGLGLAITKNLVELMNGSIELESVKGKGSLFRVLLPSTIAPFENYAEQVKPEIEMSSERKSTMLVVEDDRINQKIIVAFLSSYTDHVDLASDGKEAMEFVKRHVYDVIFMDIQLPGIDGVEVMKTIRELYREEEKYTPIIAVTANALWGDRERFLNDGFDDYISKPYDKDELAVSIKKTRNKEYMHLKDKYYDRTVIELFRFTKEQWMEAKIAFKQAEYVKCRAYLSRTRELCKGLGYSEIARSILKLLLKVRNEEYEVLEGGFKKVDLLMENVKMEEW